MDENGKDSTRSSGIHRLLTVLGVLTPIILPIMAFAAGATFDTVVGKVLTVLQSFVGALIALAVFLLMFGIFRYISAGDDPKRLAEGGRLVMWGVISVFVMVSFWGLVHIVLNTFFDSSDLGNFQLDSSLWNQN